MREILPINNKQRMIMKMTDENAVSGLIMVCISCIDFGSIAFGVIGDASLHLTLTEAGG